MRPLLIILITIFCISTQGQQTYNLDEITDVFIHGPWSQYEIGRYPVGGGDFNGDGYGDLIIGTDLDVCYECPHPSFVLLGGSDFSHEIDLRNLPEGSLKMIDFNIHATVTGLEDFNGDGYDDMLFADSGASPDGLGLAGEAIILYGTDVFPATMSVDSTTFSGVRIKGSRFWGFMGIERSLGSAGDVNGDGFADALLGTTGQGITDDLRETFIIYGGMDVPSELYTHQLGRNGVRIVATDPDETFGYAMTGVGDVNGDGIDDVLIGSQGGLEEQGYAYLIYGATDLPELMETENLGSHGVRIVGTGIAESFGSRVSAAGDINKDGLQDFMISALGADPGGVSFAGQTFIILGSRSLPSVIQVTNLGNLGITINGTNFEGTSGRVIAPGGDINGDGYDDVVIGEGYQTGRIHLVFGRPSIMQTRVVNLEDLERIVIEHDNPLSYFPSSMSSVGDINGDGMVDWVVGDMGESPYDRFVAGTCFVIYGGKFLQTPTPTETPVSPTPTVTPTVTFTPTPPQTGGFSGWILSGDGKVVNQDSE